MSDAGRRLLLVVTLVAVFGGIAAVDRVVSPGTGSSSAASVPAASALRVAPVGVDSAAWYCAGGTNAPGGASPTLLLVNTGPAAVPGTVTVVSPGAATVPVAVSVPAGGSAQMALDTVATGSDIAASVVLDGGGVAAWEEVQGPSGWSVAPCSSVASSQWYFAHGSTQTGDSCALALYNPGVTDAVVDVTLLTSTQGAVEPAAYQGVEVAAGSLVVENVGDHVQDDPAIAIEVTTLSGTLVAFERQTTGQPGQGGLSLVPGAPSPSGTSAFAQSTNPPGGSMTYDVVNPSPGRVAVSAAIGLQHGSAAPLVLDLPPQSAATLDAGGQTRIPQGTPYSVTFTSSGGGVVVSRVVRAPSGTSAPQVGVAAAVAAGPSRWVVPAVPAPGTGAWYLAVADLAGRPVSVTVLRRSGKQWQPVPGLSARIGPGAPYLVAGEPHSLVGSIPLEVRASGPVAVQLDATPAGGPGVVVVPGLALG